MFNFIKKYALKQQEKEQNYYQRKEDLPYIIRYMLRRKLQYISFFSIVYNFFSRCGSNLLYLNLYTLGFVMAISFCYTGFYLDGEESKLFLSLYDIFYVDIIRQLIIMMCLFGFSIAMMNEKFTKIGNLLNFLLLFSCHGLTIFTCYFYYKNWNFNIAQYMIISTNLILCSTLFTNITFSSEMKEKYFHNLTHISLGIGIILTAILSTILMFI